MTDSLQHELDRRKARGNHPTTVAGMNTALAKIGYKMDRSMNCHGISRILTGEFAGESYPCTTTNIKEIDTGISAYHYKNARRDANFRELQRIRFHEELYAVVRGRILEI
jgi:hypothetical protein